MIGNFPGDPSIMSRMIVEISDQYIDMSIASKKSLYEYLNNQSVKTCIYFFFRIKTKKTELISYHTENFLSFFF